MYQNGVELPKPTIVLCGSGNTSGCHGLAHHERLHFRWVPMNASHNSTVKTWGTFGAGHWEYLITDEPTKYQKALDMDGWRELRHFEA